MIAIAGHRRYNTPADPPTPEQIAEHTAKIKRTWSELERRNRAGYLPPTHWTPPVVPIAEIDNGLDYGETFLA